VGHPGDRGLRGTVGPGEDFRSGGHAPGLGRVPAPRLPAHAEALRFAVFLVAISATIFLCSCGGESNGDDSQPRLDNVGKSTGEAPGTVAVDVFSRKAEGICRRSLAATRALGRRLPQILDGSSFAQEAVTSGLVKPGVAILSTEAARLRALGTPEADALQTYVGLFEPIVELGRQRLDAEAGEIDRMHSLEQLIAGLEDEQSAIARRSGLKACAVSFNRALAQSG